MEGPAPSGCSAFVFERLGNGGNAGLERARNAAIRWVFVLGFGGENTPFNGCLWLEFGEKIPRSIGICAQIWGRNTLFDRDSHPDLG